LTCYPGSYLAFRNRRLKDVITTAETTVNVNKKEQSIEANKLIQFNEDGTIENIFTPKLVE
jgi:hypothetical protein